nr:hypothetical protein BaRGS_022496 [Batillaria attramentaria]
MCRDFQFLWMSDPETVNSITMSFRGPPLLVVLQSETQQYYLPLVDPVNITTDTFTAFLDDVRDGKVEAFGGTGFFQRLKRMAFDFLTTIVGIWQTSRWLFLLMFGLPTLIISVICYSLCCMDSVDDPDEDELERTMRCVMEQVELPQAGGDQTGEKKSEDKPDQETEDATPKGVEEKKKD